MSAGDNLLDVQAALARLGGNTGIYAKLLDRFRANYPADAPQLEAAVSSGDMSTAEREAHTIKGLAGSLGADSLQAAAYELEKACKAGLGSDECRPLLEAVKAKLADALSAIDAYLEGAQKPAAPAVMDKAALRGRLYELLALFEENDAHAAKVFAEIAPSVNKYDPDLGMLLQQAVDEFDFNQALGLTAAMLGQLD